MLSCPLCCQSQFSSIDLLRNTLLMAIHRTFVCPICNEMQHGLSNLASHLSKHIEVPSQSNYIEQEQHKQIQATNDVNSVIQSIAARSNSNNNKSETICRENRNCEKSVYSFDDSQNAEIKSESETDESKEKMISFVTGTSVLDQKSILKVNEASPASIHTEALQMNNNVQVFFCQICACSFRSKELQQMHMQLVHEINMDEMGHQIETKVNDVHNIFSVSSEKAHSNLFQCDLCAKRFKMIGSLRLHVRMVHGVVVAQVAQKTRNSRNIANKYEIVNNNNHSTKMSGHEIRAGEPNMEQSAHANNPIISPLNAHASQIDNFNSNNYGASNALFTDNDSQDIDGTSNGSNNNKETIQIQNEDRVHECDICNKHFTTKYFLKKHKRIHTGESGRILFYF